MFKNLDAEQARHGHSNARTAEMLGISRVSYESKKKTGKFTALECKRLCAFYGVPFSILFQTEDEHKSA